MKKSELRQIIREEIKRQTLNEGGGIMRPETFNLDPIRKYFQKDLKDSHRIFKEIDKAEVDIKNIIKKMQSSSDYKKLKKPEIRIYWETWSGKAEVEVSALIGANEVRNSEDYKAYKKEMGFTPSQTKYAGVMMTKIARKLKLTTWGTTTTQDHKGGANIYNKLFKS